MLITLLLIDLGISFAFLLYPNTLLLVLEAYTIFFHYHIAAIDIHTIYKHNHSIHETTLTQCVSGTRAHGENRTSVVLGSSPLS